MTRIHQTLYLLITLFLISSPSLEARTLHGIILADTLSPTGQAPEGDSLRVQRRFEEIGEHTGHAVQIHLYTGNILTVNSVLNDLNSLVVDDEDLVFVYCIGHGYRTTKKSDPWPLLYFTAQHETLDMNQLIQLVTAKKPKLGIIVSDCCNNILDNENPIPFDDGIDRAKSTRKRIHHGFLHLFSDFSGIIAVAAAEQGQKAYCYQKGHYYTEAFWRSIKEEVRRSHPNWPDLLARASKKVAYLQTPYYEIYTYP